MSQKDNRYSKFNKLKNIIYIFKCPFTGAPKYIGQSSSGKKRLYSHFCSFTRKKHNHLPFYRWLNKLGKVEPILELIETTSFPEELDNREIYWIAHFKSLGFKLLNLTDGGKSFRGFKRQTGSSYSRSIFELHSQKIFRSVKEASNFFKIERRRISNCLVGRSKHVQGYIFLPHNNDCLVETSLELTLIRKEKFLTEYSEKKTLHYKQWNKHKRISVKELTTGLTFTSLKAAGIYFNMDHSHVKKCALGTAKNSKGLVFNLCQN